jgi:hypothetical protein
MTKRPSNQDVERRKILNDHLFETCWKGYLEKENLYLRGLNRISYYTVSIGIYHDDCDFIRLTYCRSYTSYGLRQLKAGLLSSSCAQGGPDSQYNDSIS